MTNKYECWAPLAPAVPHVILDAATSFDARKAYAAQHTAMSVSDVVAVRAKFSFFEWFDNVTKEAAQTEPGKLFVAAGFRVVYTGGGWRVAGVSRGNVTVKPGSIAGYATKAMGLATH